jgi:hypothetical protein
MPHLDQRRSRRGAVGDVAAVGVGPHFEGVAGTVVDADEGALDGALIGVHHATREIPRLGHDQRVDGVVIGDEHATAARRFDDDVEPPSGVMVDDQEPGFVGQHLFEQHVARVESEIAVERRRQSATDADASTRHRPPERVDDLRDPRVGPHDGLGRFDGANLADRRAVGRDGGLLPCDRRRSVAVRRDVRRRTDRGRRPVVGREADFRRGGSQRPKGGAEHRQGQNDQEPAFSSERHVRWCLGIPTRGGPANRKPKRAGGAAVPGRPPILRAR